MKERGPLADRSGTIDFAGYSQLVIPESLGRSYLFFQALDADMWLNFGKPATAGAGSILVEQGTSREWTEFVPTEPLFVLSGAPSPSSSSSLEIDPVVTSSSSSSSSHFDAVPEGLLGFTCKEG